MNVNEWGVRTVFSTGFDMSGFAQVTITFTKPDKTTLAVIGTPSNHTVTVPGVDLQTTRGLFPAHQYVEYIFQPGDVDQVGEWSARVTYDDAGQHLISDPDQFTINP